MKSSAAARGAIAALGFNYYEVGRQTGHIVVKVLNGQSPGNIPVQGVKNTELFVNPGAAKRMGLTLSPEFLSKAKSIVE